MTARDENYYLSFYNKVQTSTLHIPLLKHDLLFRLSCTIYEFVWPATLLSGHFQAGHKWFAISATLVFLHFCCSLWSFCVAPLCGSLLVTPFLMVLLGGSWWSLHMDPTVWRYWSFCMASCGPFFLWSFCVTMVLSSCSLWPFCVVTFGACSWWSLWSCCIAPYGLLGGS